jgi:hypothetical protein
MTLLEQLYGSCRPGRKVWHGLVPSRSRRATSRRPWVTAASAQRSFPVCLNSSRNRIAAQALLPVCSMPCSGQINRC